MEMAKSLEIQNHLAYMETVTRRKSKKDKALNLLNGLLIAVEMTIYVLLFFSIFNWYIEWEINDRYLYLLGFVLVVYSIFMLGKGLFRLISPYSWVGELFQLIKIVFLVFMITAGMLFLLKVSYDFSRMVIGLFFLAMFLCAWLMRIVKRGFLYWLTVKQVLTKNVLIIGAGKIGQSLYDRMTSTKTNGYQVIGFLDDHKQDKRVKGCLSDIERVIEQYEIDEIIVTIPSERNYIYNLLRNTSKYKIQIKIIPELYGLVSTKVGYDQVDPYPFVEVGNVHLKGWYALTKRLMDIVISSIALVMATPLMLILWCLVKICSPGPAIFKQTRIGKDGKQFQIYKFRSMVMDAEQRLRDNPELFRQYVENNYKLEPDQDPRITRLGKFLRRTSLDELPQLWNVLKGDMSLVGPRPVVREELQEYDQLIFDFLSVKPGITGYWQVSGRSDTGYPERVDIELYYVYNQSLALDFKIMLKTITAVLRRKGAY